MVNESTYRKLTKGTGCDFCCKTDWSDRDWIHLPMWSNWKSRWNRLNCSSQNIRQRETMNVKGWEISEANPSLLPGSQDLGAGRGLGSKQESPSWRAMSPGRPQWLDVTGLSAGVGKPLHRKNSGDLQRVPRKSLWHYTRQRFLRYNTQSTVHIKNFFSSKDTVKKVKEHTIPKTQ